MGGIISAAAAVDIDHKNKVKEAKTAIESSDTHSSPGMQEMRTGSSNGRYHQCSSSSGYKS